MKALLSRAPGPPQSLEIGELPSPQAGKGEVVIKVRAVGVNYPDVLIIEDKYQFKPERPFAPGGEFSGVVASTGEGVRRLKVGDRVFGLAGWGAMAEEIAVLEDRCVPMPEAMDFETAAALLMTYATSWYALSDRARLKAAETLLVLGAAGGVGLAAVELGKAAGARVVAAVSSEDKAAVVRERGADEVVIYPRGPFDKTGLKALSEQFKAACGPGGADVVYDAVGGDYTEAALRAIAWDGRLLVIGFPAGIPSIPLNLTLLKSCSIVGVFWGAFAARDPARNAELTAQLLKMWAGGDIRPYVSQVAPLERGAEAISALAERRAVGKVVVRVSK